MMRAALALIVPVLLLAGACSGDGASSTSRGEDAALNDAAAALEANASDVNAAVIVDEPEGNAE